MGDDFYQVWLLITLWQDCLVICSTIDLAWLGPSVLKRHSIEGEAKPTVRVIKCSLMPSIIVCLSCGTIHIKILFLFVIRQNLQIFKSHRFKIQNAYVQLLFCSLNLLFGDTLVAVTVAIIVC